MALKMTSNRLVHARTTRGQAPSTPPFAGAKRQAHCNANKGRMSAVVVKAQFDNPVRSAIGGMVSGIYKASATLQAPEPGLSPLWQAIKKLDLSGVRSAIAAGADLNERNAEGNTPLLYIAREGHYKFPPSEIPQALISGGADKEVKNTQGLTALQVALLSGWQNIAELLIKSGADTSGVPAVKARLTCPDCKALVLKYQL